MLHSRQPDLQRFLDTLTARSVLTEREQQAILGLPTNTSQIGTDVDFVRFNDRATHACFIVDGLVGRFNQTGKGDRQITALHIPGDMPDLHSVALPTATSGLQALTTTTILSVPHHAIRSAAAEYPGIAEAFWRHSLVDAMVLAQWVTNVGRRPGGNRIAHLLCEMAWRYNARSRDGQVVFQLPMTQTHLGDATGLTPVHVNRCLKSLGSIGASFRNKTVRINDWNALVEAGDFDHSYLHLDSGEGDQLRIAVEPA